MGLDTTHYCWRGPCSSFSRTCELLRQRGEAVRERDEAKLRLVDHAKLNEELTESRREVSRLFSESAKDIARIAELESYRDTASELLRYAYLIADESAQTYGSLALRALADRINEASATLPITNRDPGANGENRGSCDESLHRGVAAHSQGASPGAANVTTPQSGPDTAAATAPDARVSTLESKLAKVRAERDQLGAEVAHLKADLARKDGSLDLNEKEYVALKALADQYNLLREQAVDEIAQLRARVTELEEALRSAPDPSIAADGEYVDDDGMQHLLDWYDCDRDDALAALDAALAPKPDAEASTAKAERREWYESQRSLYGHDRDGRHPEPVRWSCDLPVASRYPTAEAAREAAREWEPLRLTRIIRVTEIREVVVESGGDNG